MRALLVTTPEPIIPTNEPSSEPIYCLSARVLFNTPRIYTRAKAFFVLVVLWRWLLVRDLGRVLLWSVGPMERCNYGGACI